MDGTSQQHSPIYVIGDIHGMLNILKEMLSVIKQDADHSGNYRPQLILLGDIIDRGPASKGVMDLLLSADFNRDFDATILLGNHEDGLLKVLQGDFELFTRWLHWGGAETVESYGVEFGRHSMDKVFRDFLEVFPESHRQFLEKLPLTLHCEPWFFVHAGVRPDVPLDQQKRDDLLWIMDEFLDSDADFGCFVVHGHAVTKRREIEIHPNRIALDTGAGYRGGKLSSARLENGRVTQTFTLG